MTDPTRGDLLRTLAALSDEAPDLRFGQLVANLATLAAGPTPEAVWDTEDADLLAAARRLLARYRDRAASVA